MNLSINDRMYELDVPPSTPLLTALRDYLQLTGTKYGCGEGVCGACAVLVDGAPVRACITPVSSMMNKKIKTIEGVADKGSLHPVQQAFLDHEVFQCAYCASGMVVAAVALWEKGKALSEADVIENLNGNICRCGTYPRVLKALLSLNG